MASPRPHRRRTVAAAVAALATVGLVAGSAAAAAVPRAPRHSHHDHSASHPRLANRRANLGSNAVFHAPARRSLVATGTATRAGWWTSSASGSIQANGAVRPMASWQPPAGHVVAMLPTVDGRGSWVVSSTGAVHATGDAHAYGSLTGTSHAIAAAARTPDGRGYWLTSSTGTIFAFGDARVQSRHGAPLRNVVAIAPTSDGAGYWLAGATGGVVAAGDAVADGGPVTTAANPVVAITGKGTMGYWVTLRSGVISAFGSAGEVTTAATGPVVAVAPTSGGRTLAAVTSTGGETTVTPSGIAADGGTTATAAIGASGTHLTLDGQPHVFLGVDAYELGTDWGSNAGCGGEASSSQLDQLFSSLPPDSLVRVWAFQGTIGTNVDTHQIDWTGLDRVMAAAAQYHQYVILSLGAQGGGCDGDVWQNPAWYSGGYAQVDDPTGTTPMSYLDYVTAAVDHFRSSAALAMWEPMSEAEASTCPTEDVAGSCVGGQTCPNEPAAAAALRYFFDHVGGLIHQLDPAHLVEDGLLGGGQCGTQGSDWAYVGESTGTDVLSYHDYYGSAAIGGDQWNGLGVRLEEALSIGKPVLGGEMGVEADAAGSAGCPSFAERATTIAAKISAQVAAGSSGELLWDWVPELSTPGQCSYDVAAGDPVLHTLGTEAAGLNG